MCESLRKNLDIHTEEENGAILYPSAKILRNGEILIDIDKRQAK